ncbi:MAG: ATP-binding cassette domain-containing protein [Firmicutes bacterium]|uniref:ABC-2 type transport system ATP-binding protein n=1 Tax=Melghirimyces thermohalophilus TaxID=1236220 RepID=A0A1G6IB39_9BACL|nr:ATP-binding cassette domain-containing protein [Melghirimyces thermohalophilus]MDA8351746.1 ATP-binding cassette domain-containing protein [Bacillota bacterium]SDC03658.1 ABC-2 type transport system ATP-binding protein [Melghirimyces thermohalophilus]
MLEVRNLSKRYPGKRGIEAVQFSVDRGEIVGFLGPNGAGKTTTMRLITGYLSPTEGEVRVDGQLMTEHSAKTKKKIGYLPESPPLYPEMTVEGYLRFVADLREVPVREQKGRLAEVLERTGITGREHQLIRRLSKGYKQRVGLAQAILHHPDLLILDEPTSGLDPKQITEIRELIRELGEKHTVLLSTHILPEVEMICKRVLIIDRGRLVEDDRPERLSRRLEQGFTLALEVKGKPKAAEEILASISGVKEVTRREGGSEESVKLLVTLEEESDLREQIFYAMAEAKMPILEMQRQDLSLEDVFLKLTTAEGGQRDA